MRYEQRTEKKNFFSSKKYGNGNVAGSFLFPEVSYIYLVHKQRYSTALDILALPSSSVALSVVNKARKTNKEREEGKEEKKRRV